MVRPTGVHQKMVLATGCFSGVGRSTTPDFLDKEQEVYAIIRNPTDIETLGERGVNTATLNVADQGDVNCVVDRIVDGQGRIGCFVSNAGYGQMGPVEDVPTEEIHDQFDVNVYDPYRLVHAMLPHVRLQGDDTIVNISSVIDRVTFPGTGVYADSKFAFEAMTDALRTEVEEYGIDAILIEPGLIKTQFSDRVEAEVNGNGDEADDPDRSGAYEKPYKLFDDSRALDGSGPGAIPPERVAENIINATNSARPRARYQSGTVAHVGALTCFLPDAWRDALYGFTRELP